MIDFKRRSEQSDLMTRLLGSINRIYAIIIKEMLAIITSKASRFILIVPPILQVILFGYGATFNLDTVPYSYCDMSKSALSTQVVRHLQGSGLFELRSVETGYTGIELSIDRGDALVALVFPPDFAETGEAMMLTDARNSTTAGVAAGYVMNVIAKVNAENGVSLPVTLQERLRWNENGITRFTIVPCLILALSLVQVLLLAGLSVAREREDGTFDMMLMTPASSFEILIGKAVVPMLVALAQGFMIFVIGLFWFKMPFSGAYLSLSVLVFLFALSYVGVGLAVSALVDTIQQALIVTLFIMMPSILLSGVFTSILSMPDWLQTLTILNPLRAAVTGLRMAYFEGAGVLEVLPVCGPLVFSGVGGLAWAGWLFRHKIS